MLLRLIKSACAVSCMVGNKGRAYFRVSLQSILLLIGVRSIEEKIMLSQTTYRPI